MRTAWHARPRPPQRHRAVLAGRTFRHAKMHTYTLPPPGARLAGRPYAGSGGASASQLRPHQSTLRWQLTPTHTQRACHPDCCIPKRNVVLHNAHAQAGDSRTTHNHKHHTLVSALAAGGKIMPHVLYTHTPTHPFTHPHTHTHTPHTHARALTHIHTHTHTRTPTHACCSWPHYQHVFTRPATGGVGFPSSRRRWWHLRRAVWSGAFQQAGTVP
jgi:hypothetical protein